MKKKVIVYGNCHTAVIISALKNNKYFSDNFYIYDIPQIQSIKDERFFSKKIFSDCDVFIHQSIRIDNRYGEGFASQNVIKLLSPECKVIAIPNVYHLPIYFFPQYYEANELKTLIKNRTCFFRDEIIDEGYKEHKKLDEILEVYANPFLYDVTQIQNQYKQFLQKVKKREMDWDIKISDFIDSKYKETQLFYDPNHPTNYLLEYVVYELLNILFPEKNIQFDDVLNTSSIQLDSYEMPICESVRNALGLQYGAKELRLTGVKEKYESMYLKEYVNQYISREWRNRDMNLFRKIESFSIWLLVFIQKLFQFVKIHIHR